MQFRQLFFLIIIFFFLLLNYRNSKAQIQITAGEYLFPVIHYADSQIFIPLYPKLSKDSQYYSLIEMSRQKKHRKTWAGRKIHSENFFRVDSPTYALIVDPSVQFISGKQKNYDPLLYENTRGIRVSGHLHHNLFFSSELYETQTVFPSYLEHFTDSFEVAPSLMRAKPFKEYGRDYATAYGTLAWNPGSHVQLMFARDKLLFGHGYRSMLLSANAPAFTFLRTSVNYKKWSYNFILSALQNVSLKNIIDVPQSSMGGYQNKYANFLIIGFRPLDILEISLFESMIWAPFNNRYNQLHWKHFNPIPFSKTLWYGMDNRNNTMTGLQFALNILPHITIYGQYVLDQATESMKMTAMQAGIKMSRQFQSSLICLRTEMNTAGAYTYSHSDPLQGYSHYHHSLAHPLGANFREYLLQGTIHYMTWIAAGMVSYTQGGIDTQYEATGQSIYGNPDISSWSGSLFPELTTKTASMFFADLKIHHIINPKSGLNVMAWVTYRNCNNTLFPGQTIDIQLGISTFLRNYNKHLSWL